MRGLIFSIGIFFSASIFAADESERLCTAGGFYTGAKDEFLSNLSMHILAKRGEFGTAKCSALWRSALDAGERISRSGQISSSTDKEIVDTATAFSSRIYSSIEKASGY